MTSQPQHDTRVVLMSIVFIIIVAILFVIPIFILSYVAANVFTASSIQSAPGDMITFVGASFTATSILAYVFFEIGKWMEDREQNNVMHFVIIFIISILIYFSGLLMAMTALYLVTGAESYLKYALGFIIASIDIDVACFAIIAVGITSLIQRRKTSSPSTQFISIVASAFQSALVPLILYVALYGISLSILRPYYQTWLSIMISNTWFKPTVNNVMLSFFLLSPFNTYNIIFLYILPTYFLLANVMPTLFFTGIAVSYSILVIMQSKKADAKTSGLNSQFIITLIISSIGLATATSYLTSAMAWLILGAPSIGFFYVEFLAIVVFWLTKKYRRTDYKYLFHFSILLIVWVVIFDVVFGLPINALSLTIRLLIPHIVNFALSIIIIHHWLGR